MPTLAQIRVPESEAPDFSLTHGAVRHEIWSLVNRARIDAQHAPTEGPYVAKWLARITTNLEAAERLLDAVRR